jgi:glutathione S-transferase
MRNGIKIKNACFNSRRRTMDLYFSPLACSMATRIALYEAGAEARYLEVDPKSKKVLQDNSDFRSVNPLGLVPTVSTDDGLILTENAAILQYVADRFPDVGLGATSGIECSRLHQWLCFIGTELHKVCSSPCSIARRQPMFMPMRWPRDFRGSTTSTPIWKAANSCSITSASPTPISAPY